jgi:hypothetical protein
VNPSPILTWDLIDTGVVVAGVVGVAGTENMPAACAYDIFGEDGDSDAVGEHEDTFIFLFQSGPSERNPSPFVVWELIDLGVVAGGVVGIVGIENTPAACAYDILGEDGDSDGVGGHGAPGPFGSWLAFTPGLEDFVVEVASWSSGVIYRRAAKVDLFGSLSGRALIVVYWKW